MDFLKKAKAGLKELQDTAEAQLKNLNLGDKKPEGSSTSAAPKSNDTSSVSTGYAPSATTQGTPSVAYTPSTTTQATNSGDLNIPRNTEPGAPTRPSLADRKKFRDDFENHKTELQQGFSKILGGNWGVHADFAGLYTYMGNDSSANTNPGVYIKNYFDGALNNLVRFSTSLGPGAIESISTLAPTHLITLEPTTDPSVRYHSLDFHEGRWRLLFQAKMFGWNASSCGENLEAVLNSATKSSGGAGGAQALSLIAKRDIRDRYEAEVGAVLTRAKKLLNEPNLQFEPNFEANYAVLAAFDATLDREEREDNDKLRKDWETTVGGGTLDYFKGFINQLEYKKFMKDEMMQEAFKDAVETNIVAFEVKNGDLTRRYNDSVIEGGKLIMRTNPWNWWSNADSAADKVDSLL